MSVATPDPRRAIPRTDTILADARLTEPLRRLGPKAVKAAVVAAQESARQGDIPLAAVIDETLSRLRYTGSSLRPVINATGVVLHTNLGRAALSPTAVDALIEAAGYVDIEYDVRTGDRARRGRGAIAALAEAVPDAAAVHIVNNGAAALVLAATALAAGKDIVVSRGELVEIGDGFRLPDLLVSTGARLREVGTTNRTTIADYRAALTTETALILKVHPSNFVISGFTSAVSCRDLATLGVPVVVDVGSGLLAPDPLLPGEPDIVTALRHGASLVTASADKLLGGPQAGLILGDNSLVEQLRRHPLARALRIDKLTAAALEATLRGPTTPTSHSLHADTSTLLQRTERLAAAVNARVVPHDGLVGGGGAPGVALPGYAVALPVETADRLRRGDPCVVVHVADGHCLIDLRCVPADRDGDLVAAVLRGS